MSTLSRVPSSLGARLALTRPLNCFIAAVSVAIGAVTSGLSAAVWPVAAAALSAALITAAGNAYNDVTDLEIDRVNRPGRPLPSGRLQPSGALRLSALLAVVGVALAWSVGPLTAAIAIVVVVGLTTYSAVLKTRPAWGTLMVSSLAAAAFPFGAAAAGSWGRWWIPAGFAFLFHLGREIVKDVEDMTGDRAMGARTLAISLGAPRAATLAATVYLLLVAATIVPWLHGIYGWAYLAPVALLDLLVVIVIARLVRAPERNGQDLSKALTGGMALGLLAIVLGELQ